MSPLNIKNNHHKKYLAWFLDMMAAEKGAADNTLAAYRRDINQFFAITGVDVEQISSEDVAFYVGKMGEKAFAPKTQARKLSALREFCRFLFSEKILKDNPTANILTPKQEKPLPKFLTPLQICQLIKQAQNHKSIPVKRIGVMIQLMFATGLRVSELVSLPENAINYDKLQLNVRGKGSKERLIPISQSAKDAVLEYTNKSRDKFIAKGKKSPWLFPSKTAADGHITRDAFFKELKKLAAECGFDIRLISPHTLRHSFATNLINHQADLRSVQKMLGHENVATTEIYTHITSQKLMETVKQKHPLQHLKI